MLGPAYFPNWSLALASRASSSIRVTLFRSQSGSPYRLLHDALQKADNLLGIWSSSSVAPLRIPPRQRDVSAHDSRTPGLGGSSTSEARLRFQDDGLYECLNNGNDYSETEPNIYSINPITEFIPHIPLLPPASQIIPFVPSSPAQISSC